MTIRKNKKALIKTLLIVLTLIGITDRQIVWGSSHSVQELNSRLFKAVFDNNFAVVKSSITSGANVEATNDEGLTAAGLAVEKGYFNIAHYILGVMKQKSLIKKNDTFVISGKLSVNQLQTPAVIPNSNKIKISKIKSQKSLVASDSKNYQKLPESAPNPFSPNNYNNGNMPIIGEIQKSGIKSVIQNQTTNLKIKAQNSEGAPIKTPNITVLHKTQKPTPILPITKEPQKKITLKKTNNLKPKGTKVAREVEFEEIEYEEEDLFDKVWNKINKVF